MEVNRVTNKLVYFEHYQRDCVIPETIEFPIYKCSKRDCVWLLLYNDEMELDNRFFKYINICLSNADEKTRINQARDLRLLFVFLQITGYDIDNLTLKNIFELVDFLGGNYSDFGLIVKNGAGEPVAISKKSRSTVINQISSIRKFLNYTKINCAALSSECYSWAVRDHINKTLEGHIDHGRDISKYINEDEYKKLIDVIIKENDEAAYLKVELIYKYTLQYYEINKLKHDNLQTNDNTNYITVENKNGCKIVPVPEEFFYRLISYITDNDSLFEKDFTSRLYKYYCEINPERGASGGKDVCSMLRKGCIYRIINEQNGEISKSELAQKLHVKNTSYLKYYIDMVRKELSDGQRSNRENKWFLIKL